MRSRGVEIVALGSCFGQGRERELPLLLQQARLPCRFLLVIGCWSLGLVSPW